MQIVPLDSHFFQFVLFLQLLEKNRRKTARKKEKFMKLLFLASILFLLQ